MPRKKPVGQVVKAERGWSIGRACVKCGEDGWYASNNNGQKRDGWRCAYCARRVLNRNRPRYKTRLREISWKYRGIPCTQELWDRMFAAQGGGCAICGESKKKLVVDHCHDTGVVRALLCYACNVLAQEPARLRQVLDYVLAHAKKERAA